MSYAEQPHPDGPAEAFIIGRDFIGDDSVSMILGDNSYFGERLSQLCRKAASCKSGASVRATMGRSTLKRCFFRATSKVDHRPPPLNTKPTTDPKTGGEKKQRMEK